MPSVFLSYSRDDLSLIEHLERLLKSSPEISIWRDQEKLYGGQKWPKILGEAIADRLQRAAGPRGIGGLGGGHG